VRPRKQVAAVETLRTNLANPYNGRGGSSWAGDEEGDVEDRQRRKWHRPDRTDMITIASLVSAVAALFEAIRT
jgi:hypothetical protein